MVQRQGWRTTLQKLVCRWSRAKAHGSDFGSSSDCSWQHGVGPQTSDLKVLGSLIFMRGKSYTFFIASTPGKLRKVIVPAYVLHGIAVLALIGSITVTAAVGSYSRMLWKVGNYNALRHDQETLKKQYQQLQSTVNDTNQRLDSLQSLATEVAMTYGVLRYHPAAFDQSDN